MKKRIISLLLIMAMAFSMTGCKKEQKLDAKNMTLEEYLEAVELPKNLTISLDPSTVPDRETAKLYDNVELFHLDDKMVQELLLRGSVVQEREIPGSVSGRTAYVTTSDTYQEELIVGPGELSYLQQPLEDIFTQSVLESNGLYPQVYDTEAGKYIDKFRGIFDSAGKELDFASREEVTKQTEEFFASLGIPIEVNEIVAYDTDIFQLDYELQQRLYEKQLQETPNQPVPVPVLPQKSDEFYEVLWRPILDGIPLATYTLRAMDDASWVDFPCFTRYTKDGIMRIGSAKLVDPAAEGTETEILSAPEALELVKEYYNQSILLKQHDIEGMELVYISYRNEDFTGISSIRPYWLIKTSYQQNYPYPKYSDWEENPLEGEIKAYDYTYFDAVTGEIFIGSTSAKPD